MTFTWIFSTWYSFIQTTFFLSNKFISYLAFPAELWLHCVGGECFHPLLSWKHQIFFFIVTTKRHDFEQIWFWECLDERLFSLISRLVVSSNFFISICSTAWVHWCFSLFTIIGGSKRMIFLLRNLGRYHWPFWLIEIMIYMHIANKSFGVFHKIGTVHDHWRQISQLFK